MLKTAELPQKLQGIFAEHMRKREPMVRRMVDPLFADIGEPPNYPASVTTVLRLLIAQDFDVTIQRIVELERTGLLELPPPGSDWSAEHIARLICALDLLGCWCRLPSKQDHKKSAARRVREIFTFDEETLNAIAQDEADFAAVRDAKERAVVTCANWHFDDLLTMLARVEDPELRDQIVEMVRLKADFECNGVSSIPD